MREIRRFFRYFAPALLVACGAVGCRGIVNLAGHVGDGHPGTSDGSTSSDPARDAGANDSKTPIPAGDAGASDSWRAACDHYHAASDIRCGGPAPPKSEVERLRARFEQTCRNQIGLPGSGVTPKSLEACATALEASPCEFPDGLPSVCDFHGSLPGGAACNDGIQCQSGFCRGTTSITPGGPIGPDGCGTCAPVSSIGKPCGEASCPSNSRCLNAPTGLASCVPVTEGDTGASCDGLAALCRPGLYCESKTKLCTKLGEAGDPCGVAPSSYNGGCVAPLACLGPIAFQKCSAPKAAGADCLSDLECGAGLGCVPGPCSSVARIGCSDSGTCQPVTWVEPGEWCDGYKTRCRVGKCNFGLRAPDGTPLEPMCPEIVPDGQPCRVHGIGSGAGSGPTCDAFAECFEPSSIAGGEGVCTPLHGTVCR